MKRILKPHAVAVNAALLVLALLLAACGTSVEPAARAKSPEEIKKDAAAYAELLKIFAGDLKAAGSYRIEIEMLQLGEAVSITWDWDIARGPYILNTYMGDKHIQEIHVGSEYYTSMDGGKTYKMTRSVTGAWGNAMSYLVGGANQQIDLQAAAEGYTLREGTPPNEMINGIPTKYIVATVPKEMLTEGIAERTIHFWVGPGDEPALLRARSETTTTGEPNPWDFSPEGATPETTAPTTSTLLVTWSKLNEEFTVQAPAEWTPSDTP